MNIYFPKTEKVKIILKQLIHNALQKAKTKKKLKDISIH